MRAYRTSEHSTVNRYITFVEGPQERFLLNTQALITNSKNSHEFLASSAQKVRHNL